MNTTNTEVATHKGRRVLERVVPPMAADKKTESKKNGTKGSAREKLAQVMAKKNLAKASGKNKKKTKLERTPAKFFDPKTNKALSMKKDLKPYVRVPGIVLTKKHFGLALMGLTRATDSYIKHRVGSWGLKFLIDPLKILKADKKLDGVFNIDRKAADERYAKVLAKE